MPPDSNLDLNLDSPEIQAMINKVVEERLQTEIKSAVTKETEGLIKNRDQILAEKKELKSRMDEWQSKYPMDELDDILKERKENKLKLMTEEERFKEREKELIEKFAKEKKEFLDKFGTEKEELSKSLQMKDKSLREYLIDAELTREITASGGIPELLSGVMKQHLEVLPENDKYVVRVMKDGNPRIGDSSGNPMTIAQLVEEYKNNPTYQPAWKPSGATGGDARGQERAAASGALKRSEMGSKEKSEYISKHGVSQFLDLPE